MTAIDGNILDGVSTTTLWTLHNRGTEAKRSDGVIRDPLAVTLLDAISYDYLKFGKPNQSHGLRAVAFDAAASAYLTAHPEGVRGGAGRGPADQLLAAGTCRRCRPVDLVLSRSPTGHGSCGKSCCPPTSGSSRWRSRRWTELDGPRRRLERGVHHRRGAADVSRTCRRARPDPRLRGPLPRRPDDVRLDPALALPAHAEGAQALRPLYRPADAVRVHPRRGRRPGRPHSRRARRA